MNAKKIITGLMFIFLSVLLFSSCKEDTIDVYNGETNIYFSLKRWDGGSNGLSYTITDFPVEEELYSASWSSIREARDSILVSMALDGTDEGEKVELIPVNVSGNITDYDRKIEFNIDLQSTTAVPEEDFKAEGLIPAGKRIGAIAVRLNRVSFRDTTLSMSFNLVPNEHFQTNYRVINRSSSDTSKVDLRSFKLVATSILTPPVRWESFLKNYMGPFSRKKVFLLLEITGGNIEELYAPIPSIPLMTAWGKTLKNYLLDQKNKGNTIYEEDGTEMTAGPNA